MAGPVARSETGAGSVAGAAAPQFELPRIGADGSVVSHDLFSRHVYTFLVFWDSGCPRCVEKLFDCESFYQTYVADSIAVVGIHAHADDDTPVVQAIADAGVTFEQAWDRGGRTKREYGPSVAEFCVFLVDRRGTIVEEVANPEGDTFEILESMWRRAQRDPQPTSPPVAREFGGFTFQADARIRFLAIDSRGAAAAGPYGEALHPGNDVQYRFELEATRRIGQRLVAGGLLRISNEGEGVLEAGPKYLGAEWGSAFAELFTDRFSLRVGYYDLVATPLTAMRWDWNDNPRIGGNAGCGCGAAAGVLLVESLEELSEELVFEGAVVEFRGGGARMRAFYAIPRRARETSFLEVRQTGADPAKYSLEFYGVESVWRRADARTGSAWRLGARIVGSREDRRSVDFQALGYAVPQPWNTSALVTVDWQVPIVRGLDLAGESTIWGRATTDGLAPFDEVDRRASRGNADLVGVVYERPPGWRVRCDYLRLESDFYSPFAALSYTPNRQGVRASVGVPLLRGDVVASAFYKRLEEVTSSSEPPGERAQESLFGTSVDVALPHELGASVGWIDNGTWRVGRIDRFDETRRAFVATVRWPPAEGSVLEAQYQRIDVESRHHGQSDDALANLFSVYLRASL